MEQLLADRAPQRELFTPTDICLYADLQEVVRKAPRPEKLDVDLGACREEARLSPGLRDVMGAVYDQLRWNSLLGAQQGNRLNKLLTRLYFLDLGVRTYLFFGDFACPAPQMTPRPPTF